MKRLILVVLMFLAAGLIDLRPINLEEAQSKNIKVLIEGAVQNPGYIELEKYACEQDALNQAVPLANADLSGINPMTILKDKDYINVPVKKTEAETVKVSINHGTLEELSTLPGIGDGTAGKIIAYRNEKGLFQSLDDLKQVKGIGDAKFEKLKDKITL